MVNHSSQVVEAPPRTLRWSAAGIAVLVIVSIAAFGLAWHNSIELRRSERALSAQMKKVEQDNSQRLAGLEQKLGQQAESATAASSGFQSDLGTIEKRLRLTESNLKKARESGARVQQEDAEKLARMDLDMQMELATKASTEDLKTVNGSVNNVRTDLEGTKNDLKMTRSELGTLIARNHEEIEILRRMGERDYVEFTVQGKNKPQIVGNIIVELRAVNTKKNRFTVALTVDDVRSEKKDRTIDEPIIFYPRGSRQADEFVVNSAAKDQITGYLSVPKNPPASAGLGSPKH